MRYQRSLIHIFFLHFNVPVLWAGVEGKEYFCFYYRTNKRVHTRYQVAILYCDGNMLVIVDTKTEASTFFGYSNYWQGPLC